MIPQQAHSRLSPVVPPDPEAEARRRKAALDALVALAAAVVVVVFAVKAWQALQGRGLHGTGYR